MAKADEEGLVSSGTMFTAPLIGRLEQLHADPAFRDDHHALYCCRLALDALEQGNYGVAAILTDPQGEVVAQSENQVFSAAHDSSDRSRQGFSSRAHAEMLLIDQLEDNLIAHLPQQLTMLVSLEPCPMCLARLLLSGIGSVRYIAADSHGGMLHCVDKLPPAWRNLSQLQTHYQAHVSEPVRQLATDISSANLPVLREKLLKHIRP
ncbi:cytosine deaminase [Amphritea atlantica]|uniref:Cytosine deaminase n=1 Tax=Amphritea atlantica TaxID=355243 RepID=A0A1H9DFR1_9GAMM|nr:nucleoside deaminase [Amphritea atlantica]SEQ12320.1 cytosine deaminase [Amphritea atlantica]